MKLAFYKAFQPKATSTDKVIACCTFGKYSHVEIIFDDGESFSISPRDGGSRYKSITYSPDSWDIYEVETFPNSEEIIKALINEHYLGKEYDYFGAVSSAFPFCIDRDDRLFCSEVVVKLFRMLPGFSFLGISCMYSPNELCNIFKENRRVVG